MSRRCQSGPALLKAPPGAHQHTTRGHPQLSTAPLSAPKTPVGPSLEEEQPQTPPWPGQKRRWVRAIYPLQRRGAVTDQTGEILNRGGIDLSLLQPHRGSLIHHQPAAPSSFFFSPEEQTEQDQEVPTSAPPNNCHSAQGGGPRVLSRRGRPLPGPRSPLPATCFWRGRRKQVWDPHGRKKRGHKGVLLLLLRTSGTTPDGAALQDTAWLPTSKSKRHHRQQPFR